MYIDLLETIANLEHISSVIQRRWGADYTIVTSDGLPLEDSPATQGKDTRLMSVSPLSFSPIQDYHSGKVPAERCTQFAPYYQVEAECCHRFR